MKPQNKVPQVRKTWKTCLQSYGLIIIIIIIIYLPKVSSNKATLKETVGPDSEATLELL